MCNSGNTKQLSIRVESLELPAVCRQYLTWIKIGYVTDIVKAITAFLSTIRASVTKHLWVRNKL